MVVFFFLEMGDRFAPVNQHFQCGGLHPPHVQGLAEYAAALKAEKEQGKETKPGKKTEKKPSIRAQLKADKERAAQRKQARSKSQDLERS